MKLRIITAIYLSFIAAFAIGQDSVKHVVQRGETIDHIAQMYGITTDELKASNFDMDVLYTGLTIHIPPRKSTTYSAAVDASPLSKSISVPRMQAYKDNCVIADNLFDRREYKKAQKRYKQIVSEFGNELPCSDAIYSIALCSYNLEKWKSAIEDLSAVIDNESCTSAQRSHCKKLLAKAHDYRDQQLENRANFWGGLITTAAVVGTSVALSNSNSHNSTSSNGISDSSPTYSSSSSESSSSTSGSTSSGKAYCKSLRVANGKWYCCNTGRCGMCNGDGLMDDGIKVNQFKCTLCGGTGKCKYCQ